MRVLQVLGNLGYGGIESFIMNVYNNINHDKIQFDFLVRSDDNGDKVQQIESMGGKIFFSPDFLRHPLKNYKYVKNFFDKHSEEYNAIHIHCNSFIYPLPVKLAHKHKIKTIILHSHNTCNHGAPITLYHKINEKRYDKYLDYRFACSEAAGRWMFGNKSFSVIRNGIDLEIFTIDSAESSALRQKLDISDTDLVIGHVGRFAEQKNHEFIIDLFKELHFRSNSYKLLLVGDGELKKSIEDKVKECGLSGSVIFTGPVNNVQDYMQAMDLFILPSLFEGLPVTGVEAQACGLPCIFSDAITEEVKIADNVTFISLEDKKRWIDSAETMIIRPKTDNSKQIRSAGYDIKETAKKLEKLYLNR